MDRWRNTEVLRAIEFSVRGPTWDTVAPEVMSLEIGEPDGDGRLTVVLELRHRQEAIDLGTTARLTLDPAGALAFSTRSEARTG